MGGAGETELQLQRRRYVSLILISIMFKIYIHILYVDIRNGCFSMIAVNLQESMFLIMIRYFIVLYYRLEITQFP